MKDASHLPRLRPGLPPDGVLIQQQHEYVEWEREAPKRFPAGETDESPPQAFDALPAVEIACASRRLAIRLRDRAAPTQVHQARPLLEQRVCKQYAERPQYRAIDVTQRPLEGHS